MVNVLRCVKGVPLPEDDSHLRRLGDIYVIPWMEPSKLWQIFLILNHKLHKPEEHGPLSFSPSLNPPYYINKPNYIYHRPAKELTACEGLTKKKKNDLKRNNTKSNIWYLTSKPLAIKPSNKAHMYDWQTGNKDICQKKNKFKQEFQDRLHKCNTLKYHLDYSTCVAHYMGFLHTYSTRTSVAYIRDKLNIWLNIFF